MKRTDNFMVFTTGNLEKDRAESIQNFLLTLPLTALQSVSSFVGQAGDSFYNINLNFSGTILSLEL